MRINTTQVLLSAQHLEKQHITQTEQLATDLSTRAGDGDVEGQANGHIAAQQFVAQIIQGARQLGAFLPQHLPDDKSLTSKNKVNVLAPVPIDSIFDTVEISPLEKTKIQLITAAIEGIKGGKINLIEPPEWHLKSMIPIDPTTLQAIAISTPPIAEPLAATHSPPSTAALPYRRTEIYSESESMQFSAQGQVQTADGKEIMVDLEISMSRQFYSENSFDINGERVLQDPLVVNFSAPAAALTQNKYHFDIDSDGHDDQLHFVNPNSGFLALDRNGNGTIDNGQELFGATSGNGFNELAAFDADGNQFIDSGDPIYNRLRIWSKDQEGNDNLVALGQQQIGAIYLGHMATPFSLKNAQNQLAGQVQASSFFLREDGSSGSIQQIDLVV